MRAAKQRQERPRILARIENFPIWETTQKEFDKIPYAKDLEEDFLKTCSIGSLFRSDNEIGSRYVVIGQIVKGDDMFCSQWGAGLCVPERGINRFRVKIGEFILQY